MNKELQKKLSNLENLIGIQKDCLERGYMHGMLNGLICAHSVMTNDQPKYVTLMNRIPGRTKIRHKSRRYILRHQ